MSMTGCRHRHETVFPLGVTPRDSSHDRERGSYPRAQITTGPTEGGAMMSNALLLRPPLLWVALLRY